MVVRVSILAFAGVLVSVALLLGLSVGTNTRPYDYPLDRPLLVVFLLCYKEPILNVLLLL